MILLFELARMLGTSLRAACWIFRTLFFVCGLAFLLSGIGIGSFRGVGIGFFYLLLAATLSLVIGKIDQIRG